MTSAGKPGYLEICSSPEPIESPIRLESLNKSHSVQVAKTHFKWQIPACFEGAQKLSFVDAYLGRLRGTQIGFQIASTSHFGGRGKVLPWTGRMSTSERNVKF